VEEVINNATLMPDAYAQSIKKAKSLKLKTANASLVARNFNYEYDVKQKRSKPKGSKKMTFIGTFEWDSNK
jgi:hypothetical protein